jgi:hypothetical protein
MQWYASTSICVSYVVVHIVNVVCIAVCYKHHVEQDIGALKPYAKRKADAVFTTLKRYAFMRMIGD